MKTILSIDGGGIRGLIPARVLAELERRTGKATSALFDLMAGTSTGGILSMGLALPEEAAETGESGEGADRPRFTAEAFADIYLNEGKRIFPQSAWRGLFTGSGWAEEKYASAGLQAVLAEYFGEAPLGNALTPVVVTAYDIQNRAPVFFKSWRSEWRTVLMREAGLATAAAPTYFEPALITANGQTLPLVDGGIFINNPALSAYAEARRLNAEAADAAEATEAGEEMIPDEDLFVASIGTGECTQPIPYEEARDWGKLSRAMPILNCVFDGVSDAVNYQMKHLLGDRFVRFQIPLDEQTEAMDDATLQRLDAFAQRLIDTHGEELDRVTKALAPQTPSEPEPAEVG